MHIKREKVFNSLGIHSTVQDLTFRAIFLGACLTIILCVSNSYLALKIGRTTLGFIPAAVLSLFVTRFFKNSNVLENNIIKTMATTGDSISAGIAFTIPALIMIGFWDHFHYWETTCIAFVGGFLGVALSIPMLNKIIIQQDLPYPEGVATAEVITLSENNSKANTLIFGGIFAATINFFQNSAKWLLSEVQFWKYFKKVPLGVGFSFSPVLVGIGYLIGYRFSLFLFIGTIITWVVGVPLYSALYDMPETVNAQFSALIIWEKIRFIGVGAMISGGFWSISFIIKNIFSSVVIIIKKKISQTNSGIPLLYIGLLFLFSLILLYAIFYRTLILPLDVTFIYGLIISFIVFFISIILILSCTIIGSYLTGLTGSTLLPTSIITTSGVSVFIFVLFILFYSGSALSVNTSYFMPIAVTTIIFASIVALSTTVSGYQMQDHKTNMILGATLWKQQCVLLLGIIVSSAVISFVLDILYNAYGFSNNVPHLNMNLSQTLRAPQATALAIMIRGIFSDGKDIAWYFIITGAVIATFIILLGTYFKKNKSKIISPIVYIIFGMYMPLHEVFPIFVGGIIAYLTLKKCTTFPKAKQDEAQQNGVLFSCGIIAGTALVEVFIAFLLLKGVDLSIYMFEIPQKLMFIISFGVFAMLIYKMYKKGTNVKYQ